MASRGLSASSRATLMILLAALAWGSSFPVIKWGLGYVDPVIFVFLRFLLATAVTLLVAFVRGPGKILELSFMRGVIFLGLLNASGYILEFTGMLYTTASKASLLVNVNVVLVALLSLLLLGESLGWRRIAALIISLLGIVLITVDGDLTVFLSWSFVGDILVLSAGVVWAIYIVYSKRVMDSTGAGALDVSLAVILLTAVIFAFPALLYGLYDASSLAGLASLQGLSALLYLGVVCTTLAFILYFEGLKRVSASVTAILLLVEIVFSVLLSSVFLGESVSVYMVAGGLAICLAVVMVSRL